MKMFERADSMSRRGSHQKFIFLKRVRPAALIDALRQERAGSRMLSAGISRSARHDGERHNVLRALLGIFNVNFTSRA